MSTFKDVRQRIGATQQELADVFDCTQGNVSLLDKGQALDPAHAKRLIAFAASKGYAVTWEEIYGPIPEFIAAAGASPLPEPSHTEDGGS